MRDIDIEDEHQAGVVAGGDRFDSGIGTGRDGLQEVA